MSRIAGNQSFVVCMNTVRLKGLVVKSHSEIDDIHALIPFWRTRRRLTVTMVAALSLLVCDPHGAVPASADGKMNMNDDVLFWKVIDSTTALESEPDKQLAALRTALTKLPLEQIERYESSFDSEMKRSFSWDLSGAAYVVHGGASDDSFEYFSVLAYLERETCIRESSGRPG